MIGGLFITGTGTDPGASALALWSTNLK